MEEQYKELLDQIQNDLADYQNETGIGMMDDQQWQDLFVERVIATITSYESLNQKNDFEEITFNLISTDIELSDEQGTVRLYETHYFEDNIKVIRYYTENDNGERRYFVATKDPEHLTKEERHRVLEYSLSSFDDNEIVNYYDLFLQGEFIKEVNLN